MTIAEFDAHDITSLPTRVELSGYIVYRAKEADGDVHLWVCDQDKQFPDEMKPGKKVRSHCFVAEIMPDLPPEGLSPVVGLEMTIDGITRWDGEHKWLELHPVEKAAVKK